MNLLSNFTILLLIVLIYGSIVKSQVEFIGTQNENSFRPIHQHLVSLNEEETKFMTTQELYKILSKGAKVFDRSYLDPKQQGVKFAAESPAIPTQINYEEEVDSLNSNLDVTDMYNRLLTLSDYHNRFYTSQFGVSSAEWIYQQYQDMIAAFPNDGVRRSVEFFNHTWPQPSVIARIEGIGSNKNEKVIIGAHEDSVNWDASNQNLALAPGACDDGSGTVTVMEIFRVMCETGSAFNRTIEFHHYAAEEVGLLGSQDIASYYASNDVPVAGYLNFDMDGYPGNPATFNLITDYTNSDLNNYVMQLIEAYTQLSYTTSKCGYACSDHASWDEVNYRASFAIENGPYPYTHTSQDSIVYIDFEYVLQYAKLGMGFLVEIGSYNP